MAELRPIAPELWVSEAPLRYFGIEMGRRMTVVRLSRGGLLVHSPAPLTSALRGELDGLGEVAAVVPASNLHGHLHMEDFQAAWPAAALFAAPGLERKRPDLRFAGRLGDQAEALWADDLDQAVFRGHRLLEEILFLHRPSRTLIAGDTFFNIGPAWPWRTRLVAWGPRLRRRAGPTALFRLAVRDRPAAAASVRRILEWDFDRILPGHGEIVETGGHEAFREAWAWVL
jgi:hypothetical protein